MVLLRTRRSHDVRHARVVLALRLVQARRLEAVAEATRGGEGGQVIADVLEGLARWTVIHGDCLDVLPTLTERSVDHVITDPPYLLDFKNCVAAQTRKGFLDKTVFKRDMGYQAFVAADVERVGPSIGRVVKRWCIVWHDAESGHIWRAALGIKHVRTGVWCRVNPAPQFTGDRPGQGFELCTIAHGDERLRWNGGGHSAKWHAAQRHGATAEVHGHPTPKPLDLMLALIEDFTDPDDVVLDAFAGSGTTGVAALRLGRRFIGIEREQKWAELSRDRLTAEEQGSTLAARRAGQIAMFGGDDA